MRIVFRVPVMMLSVMLAPNIVSVSWAQSTTVKDDQSTMICHEGANLMKFAFDGKGHAKLTRIEGPDVGYFPDLHEVDWTVSTVKEEAGTFVHIDNSRGARLSIAFSVLDKTYGRMTWNNPPGSKADILCDLHIVR